MSKDISMIMQHSSLVPWGLGKEWQQQLAAISLNSNNHIGRVVEVQKGLYQVADGPSMHWCVASGKSQHEANSAIDLPTVGDFVVFRMAALPGEGSRGMIESILPRRTLLARSTPGEIGTKQAIAANVDYVCIVTSMNRDLNLRRLERYVMIAWESGAVPVIILNKVDLEGPRQEALDQIATISGGSATFSVSAIRGEGFDKLMEYFKPGTTITLLGSSGVGKSTLVNRICGLDIQRTSEVRSADDRGRHTTTCRSLVQSSHGVLVIDTPGMRELGVIASDDEASDCLEKAFHDITELALKCKFTNCKHENEPGCVVQAAIADGSLSEDRLRSFRKLEREQAFFARKSDKALASIEKQKWKSTHKNLKRSKKTHR